MDVEIVNLNPRQWEDYKKFRLKALEEDPCAFGLSYDEAVKRTDEQWRSPLVKAEEGKNHWVYFAKLNGELVGMVSARETNPPDTEKTIKLGEVFVARSARGKGIGKKLLLYILDEIQKDPKWKRVKVKVFTTQEVAINLYKSVGFEVIDKMTESFRDGRVQDTIIMEKKLKYMPVKSN